jgi:hypothetical protein
VTEQKELSYLRTRLVQERAMAASAACEKARAAHAKMAKLYEARLTMSHVHEANPPHHLLRNRASVLERAGFA